jgi:hypothetical protein
MAQQAKINHMWNVEFCRAAVVYRSMCGHVPSVVPLVSTDKEQNLRRMTMKETR